MKAAFLPDRGVIMVSGENARGFLDGLVTTNIGLIQPGAARFGALLTPQGKIIADFLVTEASGGQGGGLLLDCAKALSQQLADRLGIYKLRAKVVVENLSDSLGVLAMWDGEPTVKPDLAFADTRNDQMGWRILVPQDLAQKAATAIGAEFVEPSHFEAHRIACGVPRGGTDFMYGDAFPHETNMDRLHGVDFEKGCYVGQEVVSRMEHRGTARTRVVRVRVDTSVPEIGAAIFAGNKSLGVMGSSSNGLGLALMRIDRAADALDAGLPLIAGGIPITLVAPDDVRADKASA